MFSSVVRNRKYIPVLSQNTSIFFDYPCRTVFVNALAESERDKGAIVCCPSTPQSHPSRRQSQLIDGLCRRKVGITLTELYDGPITVHSPYRSVSVLPVKVLRIRESLSKISRCMAITTFSTFAAWLVVDFSDNVPSR